MPEALLLGYFGAGNLGDELILKSFLQAYGDLLKGKGFSYVLTVKSAPTEDYKAYLKGILGDVEYVKISPFLPYSVLIKKASHLIAPGGSLLQNKTSSRSLILYLSVIREFTRLGKKVFLLNQGIGPIYGSFWSQMTKNITSKASFFSARDKKTALFVADVLPSERRFLASDAVFASLPEIPYSEVQDEHYEVGFVVKGDIRSAILSSPDFPPDGKIVVGVLQRVEWENPRKLERLGRKLDKEILNFVPPEKFLTKIRNCEVIFSERYHGLVLSLIAGVPFVGVGDDPKITAFCDECGMPSFTGARLGGRAISELKKLAVSRFDRKLFYERVEEYSARHKKQKEILAQLL